MSCYSAMHGLIPKFTHGPRQLLQLPPSVHIPGSRRRGDKREDMPFPLTVFPEVVYYAYLHPIGPIWVIWAYFVTKKAGKCSLYSRHLCAHHKLSLYMLLEYVEENRIGNNTVSHKLLPMLWNLIKATKNIPMYLLLYTYVRVFLDNFLREEYKQL